MSERCESGGAHSGRWNDGPPHELFKQLRSRCPVFWSDRTPIASEEGYWSVTTAAGVNEVSKDWRTYSSESGQINIASISAISPDLVRAMFIGMDPPKHDRIKGLFQAGFTPRRISRQEDSIREIARNVLDKLDGRDSCDLVRDVAQPFVSRVIGRFMGLSPQDDMMWASLMTRILGTNDPAVNPDGMAALMERDLPEVFERCSSLIAKRRSQPKDDLISVLVHAEVDGQRLQDHEIVMGFFLLMSAGTDSTKATYCNSMRALMENRDQLGLLLRDRSLIESTVEESLRLYPPFTHFCRTTTADTELLGQTIREGEMVVMWYVSSNRDEEVYEDPDKFDVRRNPRHQAFGAGGRHYCLGASLARLELKVLLEETLARYPEIEVAGQPQQVVSGFVNQLRTLPVRLNEASP